MEIHLNEGNIKNAYVKISGDKIAILQKGLDYLKTIDVNSDQ